MEGPRLRTQRGYTMHEKPYSEACEQNRAPILAVIRPLFSRAGRLLEIGSGTGQHAVYFAPRMPRLVWHTSDRIENHAGILRWIENEGSDNVRPPLALDVLRDEWPQSGFDAVFSANTAHIMGDEEVEAMFRGVARVLDPGGLYALYGPFNYRGGYTSDSNRRFDQWLKRHDPRSGIKDFEVLNHLAGELGLALESDHEMPVNNRILVWCKTTG